MKVPFNAAVVLLAICAGPLAFAQTTTPKKKKGAKPAASASASATDDTPPPPPPADTTPPPSDSASKDSAPKDDASKGAKTDSSASAAGAWDSTDTTEKPGQKYQFVGLRYRGTIIPQFFESLFVDDGSTVYSNSVGIEYERRTDGQSMIPWIMYTDYGMGDTLFLTKGKDQTDPTQYSVVNSSLKAIYLGLDEQWSVPLADHWDFEYGFGVGIGVVFGDLQNNWVYSNPNGNFHSSGGNLTLSECPNTTIDASCNPASHQNSQDAKVGGYVEKNWFNGGGVPVVFPHIAIPQLGIRYKPIKQLVARAQIGFQITGFYFQLSVDYGLEKPPEDDTGAATGGDNPAPKKKKKAPDSDSTDSSGGGDKN